MSTEAFAVRGVRNGSPVVVRWVDGVFSGDPPTVDLIEVELALLAAGADDPLVRRSVDAPPSGLSAAGAALELVRRVLDRVIEVDPPVVG